MAYVLKIVNASTLAAVVDLNGSSTTDIKLVGAYPPEPRTDESWAFSWDADGGDLLKRRDRPGAWKLVIRIPQQSTVANALTKIESVRDACLSATNALMIQRNGETAPRYYNIKPTAIAPAIRSEVEQVSLNTYKAIWRWEFELVCHPYAQSSTKHAVT